MVRRIRCLRLNLTVSLLAIVAGTSRLTAQDVLTNAAIIEMVKDRLSDDVIITQIQNSRGNYSLGYKDLLYLRSKGVSNKILSAMQAKANGNGASGQPRKEEDGADVSSPRTGATQSPQANAVSEYWQVHDVTDVMSGERHFEARRNRPVPDGTGNMNIVATCDATTILIDFTYLPNDQQTGFKRNWDGTTVTAGGLVGALIAAARHKKPWVEMRVRIDNDPPVTVSSEKDYENEAAIFFFADPLKAETGQALGKNDPATGTVVALMVQGQSAGSRDKAAKAQSILVEFTLADGRQEIIRIDPHEAGFQAFVSRCDDEFWTGPARRKAEEEARKRAEEEARIRPILVGKNNAVLGIQQPHGPAADGFKFLYSLSWPDRQYTGTVEGFARDFPAFFKRAVLTSGIAVSDQDDEIAYVINVVRTCAQITPQMALSVLESNGRKTWGGRMDGKEAVEKLGPQYQVCNKGGPISPAVTGVTFTGQRAIYLYIRPGPTPASRWQDGTGFIAHVSFSQLEHDGDDLRARLQPGADYTIISAAIHP